jgi:SAM-dependent methyltransferase
MGSAIFRHPGSGRAGRHRGVPREALQDAADRQHAHLPNLAVTRRRRTCLSFLNVYNDARRADAYATLEFPGTYWLAFRDLPEIIARHVTGPVALDFGCGAGRSTRFLKRLGFDATGVDVSASMIEHARNADPAGSYRLIEDGDFGGFEAGSIDLVFSAFAFDNIAVEARRAHLLGGLRSLLKRDGRVILLDSTAEIYTHEWVSFSTSAFPENCAAGTGDTVRIVMTDVVDQRPVVDYIWFQEDYLRLFNAAGLRLVAQHRPLGMGGEPWPWKSELSVAPWAIYVLASDEGDGIQVDRHHEGR